MSVPALRFPEFEGEWSQSSLDDLGVEISDGNYGEMYPTAEQFVKEGVPFIRANNLRDGTVRWDDMRFITPELHEVLLSGHLKLNDVLVTTRGEIGLVSMVPEHFIGANINAQLCLVRNADGGDQFFIYNYLTHSSAKRQFVELTTGSALKQLPRKNLKKIRIGFPSLPEQKKIAAFLGVVDAKIAALRDRVAELERYKRGLMQALFSQHLRFTHPDGTDFPDWEERRLGDVATRSTAKNAKLEYMRVLTNSAVQGVIDQGDYFDRDIANADNLAGYYVLKEGDFVYNPRISVSAPVGPIKRNDLGDGVMSPLYTVFRFKEKNTEFFNVFFETTVWHKYMKSVANYGARHDRMAITSGDLMNMPLPYPHPDEQAKIAEVLQAMDAKIAAVTGQLGRMQDFKKGLLQQMFV